MEKRLFLAIVLSFVVLYVWSLTVPNTRRPSQSEEITQTVDTKEVTENLPSPSLSGFKSSSEQVVDLEPESSSKEVTFISNENLLIGFSNIGGSIDSIVLSKYDASLPIKNLGSFNQYRGATFELISSSKEKIVYGLELDEIKITKTFSLPPDDYLMDLSVLVENVSNMSNQSGQSLVGYSIEMSNLDSKKKEGMDPAINRDKALNEYIVKSGEEVFRKNNAYKFTEKSDRSATGTVDWVGFRNRYFCAIIKPLFDVIGYNIEHQGNTSLNISIQPKEGQLGPNERREYLFTVYAGPEDEEQLKSYNLGFEQIKRFYRWVIFDAIAKIIYSLMHFVHNFIPNWGVCIILISIVIYFSMYPLTLRGMTSMKRMQSMQPRITALKEKYKSNPQKMNKEMMELYKTHKINPLGGCLPMLLQMPIFIGLYQVLWRDVAFKGANFLWIQDLAKPDRLFVFPFNIPFLGNEFNLLPVLMIVIMAFQQHLTAKNMNVTDPAQLQQQKMMSRIMPIMIGVIFYKFASGLTLYFTMFYLFSSFTQWKMSKNTEVVA